MELIDLVNSIIIFLSQMKLLSCLTFLGIPDWDFHSPALLDLFISSGASICSTMAFPRLGNSNHVVVSVSTNFLSYSQQGAPFHCIAYDYSHAVLDGLRDHLRDVPWEDIFRLALLLLLVNFVSGFQLFVLLP